MSSDSHYRRMPAVLISFLCLAGCATQEPRLLPECRTIPELAGLRIGMRRSQIERMMPTYHAEHPEGAVVHRFPEGSRFSSLYVQFDGDRASEFEALDYFQLEHVSRLPDVSAELERDLVASLGDPDELRSGERRAPRGTSEITLMVWKRPCGWVVATWNTDEDVRRVQSRGSHGITCWVAVSLLSPERGEERVASLQLQGKSGK